MNHPTVTDYGDENPIFYDYYGFQPGLYDLKFKSRGDSAVSQRVVELFKSVCKGVYGALTSHLISSCYTGRHTCAHITDFRASRARRSWVDSARSGPRCIHTLQAYVRRRFYGCPNYRGFHGWKPRPCQELGTWKGHHETQVTTTDLLCVTVAYSIHREEKVLILSGGLTIHNLRDFSGFSEATAKPQYRAFDSAILDAVVKTDVS